MIYLQALIPKGMYEKVFDIDVFNNFVEQMYKQYIVNKEFNFLDTVYKFNPKTLVIVNKKFNIDNKYIKLTLILDERDKVTKRHTVSK